MRTLSILIVLAIVFGSITADAQTFGRRGRRGATPPKALFVTIFTRKAQREHLKKYRPDLLPEYERDVAEVAKRIRLDYSRNFKFCPVYFFVDTMGDKIAEGKWEGVLLDSMLQPVRNPVVRPGSRDYFIAHYGNPIPQPDSIWRQPSPGDLGGAVEQDGADPTALYREGLIVTDAQFKMLYKNGPRTNYLRQHRPKDMSGREYRRYRRTILYNSKRWYVDYRPTANSYDATLRDYFREKKKAGS